MSNIEQMNTGLTESQIDAIRKTVAKDATDEELYMFLTIANKYGLDPFLKEVWFTKIKGQTTIMVSRDGYVKAARNQGNFEKLVSNAVYENDEFSMIWEGMNETIHHKHAAKERGKIIGAWAGIKLRNKDPAYIYVPYHEYVKNSNIWTKHKSAMIRKVAEKEICRLNCGITGIYTEEEMPVDFSLEESQKIEKDIIEVIPDYDEPEINNNYSEPEFTTAADLPSTELDPVALNYCKTIKNKLEVKGEKVTKSTMRKCLIRLIKAKEIDEDLRPRIIKFINNHCPEELI